ncbi:MAG: hypothetical protein AB7C96_01895 [Hydrogenovibrio sp.]
MNKLLSVISLVLGLILGLGLSLAACSDHTHNDGSHSHDKPSHQDTIE